MRCDRLQAAKTEEPGWHTAGGTLGSAVVVEGADLVVLHWESERNPEGGEAGDAGVDAGGLVHAEAEHDCGVMVVEMGYEDERDLA